MCEEKTGKKYPKSDSLLDIVAAYFAPEGDLTKITYETLHDYALLVYSRYMTNAAYDAAASDIFWVPEKYGPHADIRDAAVVEPPTTAASESKSTSGWTGDQVLRNNITFLRTTFWYLEMCLATADGDIGRVFEIMKVCFIYYTVTWLK